MCSIIKESIVKEQLIPPYWVLERSVCRRVVLKNKISARKQYLHNDLLVVFHLLVQCFVLCLTKLPWFVLILNCRTLIKYLVFKFQPSSFLMTSTVVEIIDA